MGTYNATIAKSVSETYALDYSTLILYNAEQSSLGGFSCVRYAS
jgi:hypothetical protein